jgi:ribokinase
MMTPHPEIAIVGSHAPGLFMRVKQPPLPGETIIGWDFQEPVDGGKGSNQAIAAAKLGARVSFIGCLGNDRLGDQGEEWMAQAGVDTRFIRRTAAHTGIGFILLDDHGVPAMVTSLGANAELTHMEIERALGQLQAPLLLTQFEIPMQIALQAVQYARERGMLTIVNPAPAPDGMLPGFAAANILVPNESEARKLLCLPVQAEIGDEQLASELYRASGAGCVMITLGERGMVGMDRDGFWRVQPTRVSTIDTSGAGDVFCAALSVALVRGKDQRTASKWACVAAALSVTRPGTIPAFPTLAEVEAYELL